MRSIRELLIAARDALEAEYEQRWDGDAAYKFPIKPVLDDIEELLALSLLPDAAEARADEREACLAIVREVEADQNVLDECAAIEGRIRARLTPAPASPVEKEPVAEGWRPQVLNLENGYSEFVLIDEPYFAKMNGRSDYAVLHSMDDERRVIGFRWRTASPPSPRTEEA